MIVGESFDYGIVKIISEERLQRTVRVHLIRDFYDGKKEVTVGFFPAEWELYKQRGSYPDMRTIDERGIEYYENMPDADWYRSRHEAKLKDFTDEEIVAEFNARLDCGLFHRVGIEARAVIKKERT